MTSRIQVAAKHHHCATKQLQEEAVLLEDRKKSLRVYLKCSKIIAGIFQETLQDKDGP